MTEPGLCTRLNQMLGLDPAFQPQVLLCGAGLVTASTSIKVPAMRSSAVRDGRFSSRASIAPVNRLPFYCHLEHRIDPKPVAIVAVLVDGRDHHHSKPNDLVQRMVASHRDTPLRKAIGERFGKAQSVLDLAQKQQARVRRQVDPHQTGRRSTYRRRVTDQGVWVWIQSWWVSLRENRSIWFGTKILPVFSGLRYTRQPRGAF